MLVFMKKYKMKHLLVAVISLIALTTNAQDATRKKHFNLNNGIAISGYDAVAYLTQSKAVKGKKENSHVYEGITYYFSSTANRDLFKANPAKYEPQYGGWCAYAMGNDGTKVEVDPETFKIVDGKLYLFYNSFFTNTLKLWNKNEATLKGNADKNWKKTYN